MRLDQVNLDRADHMKNPYPKGFSKMDLPDAKGGDWTVEKFKTDPHSVGLMNLRLIRDGQYRRIVPPGEYTRLTHKGEGVVMSDTPAEAHEHHRLFNMATGIVLLNGLGLGFALQALLTKKDITKIKVVEISADVLKLVSPHFKDERVEFINEDALEYSPGKQKFDVVWHDIWTNITSDNKETMAKLRRKYGKRAGWQSCWSEEYMRAGMV